ncbi:MAG: glycerol kinase GlpK [Spirochaetaceae bacterium]|nr:MAG: glycerol kinase GlpK [Spirochaetaceae bacterium]
MTGRRFILAVDQSTSATKALLFDDEAKPVHRVTIEHKQYYPGPGLVEHDSAEILAKTREAIARVVTEATTSDDRVEALAITNQRETVLAWDIETGEPVGRAMVWQDERGTPLCDELRAAGHDPDVHDRTGLLLDTYFSASKVAWLLKNNPDAARRLAAGTLAVGTVDAWLIWNLTGRQVFATDFTNACRTLLFNVHTLKWDPALLKLFGVTGVRLPEVRSSDASFGSAQIPEIGGSIPIVGVCGDSHAALFGQGAFDAGECKATFGTGSSVMLNIGRKPLTPPPGVVLSIGWGADGAVEYVFEGNIHSTGDTVRWVRDNLGLFSDYDEAEKRAAALDDTGGVYVIPAFNGLGAPHWAHGIRASIVGLSRASGADHIVRAALESIAYQIDDLIGRMKENKSVTMRNLRVDGGPTRNRFLMQFLSDIIRSPVHVASIEEISAKGVALFAGLSTGLYRDRAHLRDLAVFAESFEPEIETKKRDKLVGGWAAALKTVLSSASGHE